MQWHPNMIVPGEVFFDDNLDTTDKFIIGVTHTFPDISDDDLQQFLSDIPYTELCSRLKDLVLLGYLEEDPKHSFKIKTLSIPTIKSQKITNSQDQEGRLPAKKRIIQRRKQEISGSSNSILLDTTNNSYLDNSSSEELSLGDLEEKEKKFIPWAVQPFLDVWFEHNMYILGDSTKGFADDIEALKKIITGRYFSDKNVPFQYLDRRFSLEEWTLAVERVALMTFDPDYYPKEKKYLRKMKITKFLCNPYSTFGDDNLNSIFLRCLEEEPKSLKKKQNFNEDLYPVIRERLVFLYAEYRKEALGKHGYKPSEEELERFKLASKRIVDFFDQWKGKILDYHNTFSGKNAKVDFAWAAVLNDIGASELDLTPGFFCSNWTFEKRLPKFLKQKRYIK